MPNSFPPSRKKTFIWFQMPRMRKLLVLVLILPVLWSCKQKKVSLAGDAPVSLTDLISAFPEAKLPFLVQDTMLDSKALDSLPIAAKLVHQYIPDSVFAGDFPKGGKTKFHALGKVRVPDKETYLFLKAVGGGHETVYLLCFDEKPQFRAAMALLPLSPVSNGFAEGGMDRRYSIIHNRFRRGADGQYQYRKNVQVYNATGTFNLILTESNETVQSREVYNPLDTLPRKHKLSGDYVKDKSNMVSIRDARRNNRIAFFIHFDNNGGECTGELKGEADLVKPNVAIYQDMGDHCELEMIFSGNAVTIRELQGCGNHRGIKCFFEGSYPRRKEPARPKGKK
jgi:hypothetical protein